MHTVPDNLEVWICMNCMVIGPLTAHGRCATCDSDSVAVADMGRYIPRNEVEYVDLRFSRLLEKSAA